MSLLNSLDKTLGETTIILKEMPVIFLSYDEPNADENYDILLKNHPNKKNISRVHGVKGFDAAHKAAARQADAQRFFTIDADCQVDKSIWWKTVDLNRDTESATLSWSSRNLVNGLVYGNGGIKLWYTDHVMNMRSHEAADKDDNTNNVDFCWDSKNYKQMNNTYGTVVNNATPKQAFRAGFREGIKMGLDQGHKVPVKDFKHKMYPANFARWLIWMTIGRDVENGEYSIYGARLAAHKLYVEDFDHTMIADYDWFNNLWNQQLEELNHGEYLESRNHKLLIDLRDQLQLPLAELNAEQSIWFKHVHINPNKGLGWPALLNQSALPLYGFTLPTY